MGETLNTAVVVGVQIFVGAIIVAAVVISRRRPPADYYRVGDLMHRVEELTLELIEVRLHLSSWQTGATHLIAQITALGYAPAWEPDDSLTGAGPMRQPALVRLYQRIAEHFDLNEIDALAAEAGMPAESYGGETRQARALALVQYAARHGNLSQLLAACRKARPKVRWPNHFVS